MFPFPSSCLAFFLVPQAQLIGTCLINVSSWSLYMFIYIYKPWKDWKNRCFYFAGLHSIILCNDISLLAISNNNTYFTNRLTPENQQILAKDFLRQELYTCFMNSSPWICWNQIQVVTQNVHTKIFTLFLVIHSDSWLPINFSERIIKQSDISFPTNRQRLLDRKNTSPGVPEIVPSISHLRSKSLEALQSQWWRPAFPGSQIN